MSIDWVTVIAQIANFLVLVWLLKRFLYRPILDGIDAREAEIARSMAEAGEAQKRAQAAEADYQQQRKQLLSDQNAVVERALRESENQRDALLAEARAKLEQEQKDWHKHLERERQKFTAQLQRAGEETLLELTRKALRDLADESLEEAIARHATARLRGITSELSDAAGDSKEAVATTRDALPEAAQTQMQADIESLLPGITLRFETDPQQAPGLVLRVGSAQVAWTVDSYTEAFDSLLSERLAAVASGRVQPGDA
ncbi:F0F1 ATP synthase subunit B [Marinobacter sp. F3R11]|uniref:F0F1 ATP synthase subunit B family protein n=1 Tax=Marinobacter sp. F3R11 TaxID=2267231 RepID=UPI000DEAA3A2|nr:F0F1 ATP synthase subunit B [Marinobacter sp. F3R11]RBW51919.1 F0F1 ATP synthase subunit B [Marinobacter sp. F3R11]